MWLCWQDIPIQSQVKVSDTSKRMIWAFHIHFMALYSCQFVFILIYINTRRNVRWNLWKLNRKLWKSTSEQYHCPVCLGDETDAHGCSWVCIWGCDSNSVSVGEWVKNFQNNPRIDWIWLRYSKYRFQHAWLRRIQTPTILIPGQR